MRKLDGTILVRTSHRRDHLAAGWALFISISDLRRWRPQRRRCPLKSSSRIRRSRRAFNAKRPRTRRCRPWAARPIRDRGFQGHVSPSAAVVQRQGRNGRSGGRGVSKGVKWYPAYQDARIQSCIERTERWQLSVMLANGNKLPQDVQTVLQQPSISN